MAEGGNYSNIDAKFYIASHRKPEEIDKNMLNGAIQLGWNVLYFSNEGWEWGAYQQFLTWQRGNDAFSDYYLFLHDDIIIKKYGFLKAFLNKIQGGFSLVGNSPTISKKEEIRSHYPEDVLWAKVNGFPIRSSQWNVVRGSCFFCTKEVAETILIKMPIKNGTDLLFANCSLRVFGGLVTDRFGERSIGYIGEKPRSSAYIDEEFRGNKQISKSARIRSLIRPYINRTMIKRILRIKKVSPIKRGMGLKINLGSGTKCLYGYFNVDIASPCAETNADIESVEFKDDSVAEVLMIHIIEHIDCVKVPSLLRKIYRWLKADCQLIVEFPGVLKVCSLVLKGKNKPEESRQSRFGIRGLYAGPTENMKGHDYHKRGWTKNNMYPILQEIGFRKIYVERPEHIDTKRGIRIVGVK
ncbi:MAG: class I SAM-dependent methyltransferase [Desulfobacterales bacterium]|nr:class I SAM-dependent methyltransferase [Desulfobacterales bacterium]